MPLLQSFIFKKLKEIIHWELWRQNQQNFSVLLQTLQPELLRSDHFEQTHQICPLYLFRSSMPRVPNELLYPKHSPRAYAKGSPKRQPRQSVKTASRNSDPSLQNLLQKVYWWTRFAESCSCQAQDQTLSHLWIQILVQDRVKETH